MTEAFVRKVGRRGTERFRPLHLVVALLVVASILAGILRQAAATPEPVYEGKTVTEWLHSIASGPPTEWDAKRGKTQFALDMLGTNAVAALRRHLVAGSSVERRLWRVLPMRVKTWWHREADRFGLRLRVLEQLETIPNLARTLTPELKQVLLDRSQAEETRLQAYRVLEMTHPDEALTSAFGQVATETGWVGLAAKRWLDLRQGRLTRQELRGFLAAQGLNSNSPPAVGDPDPLWRISVPTVRFGGE